MGIIKFLPSRVCYCIPFDIGVRVLMVVILVLRLAGLICGLWYGPALYVVITVGGLYIAADVVILYTLFSKNAEGKPQCEFPDQKIWLLIWQVMNILAIIGLLVAIGLFADLGMWSMLYFPLHFVLFIIIIVLTVFLFYAAFILYTLHQYLRESYIDELLDCPKEEDDVGLTANGHRISL